MESRFGRQIMTRFFLAMLIFIFTHSAFAVRGGQVANSGELPSTIAIAALRPDGSFRTFCSGTLINSHTVLTAAHCHGDSLAQEAYIVFSLDLHKPDLIAFPILSWKLHEKWDDATVDERDPRDTHDIALATFSGPLPSTHVPASLVTDDSFVKRGSRIGIAGYGFEFESLAPGDDGWPEMPSGEGVLRTTVVEIEDPDFSATEMLALEVGQGSASADSGGSAFIQFRGQLSLWGVISRGLPGQDGVYTRVSLFIDWIRKHTTPKTKISE